MAAASAMARPCSARPSSQNVRSEASPSCASTCVSPWYQTGARSAVTAFTGSSTDMLFASTAVSISSPFIVRIGKRGWCGAQSAKENLRRTVPEKSGVIAIRVAARCRDA